jgi:hypothetical protein
MSEYFEYRAYIGPPWKPTSVHYHDWSQHDSGISENLGIATVAASTLNSGDTTLSLFDATSFPSDGWVWIGPGKLDGSEGCDSCYMSHPGQLPGPTSILHCPSGNILLSSTASFAPLTKNKKGRSPKISQCDGKN